MSAHKSELSDVTCWMGHEIPQEQWRVRRTSINGRPVRVCEYDCHCGERITVIEDGETGAIIEEESRP